MFYYNPVDIFVFQAFLSLIYSTFMKGTESVFGLNVLKEMKTHNDIGYSSIEVIGVPYRA